MFHYDYHCLIDNKRLRTHLLFHLYLRYNTCYSLKLLNYWNYIVTNLSMEPLLGMAHDYKYIMLGFKPSNFGS